MSLIFGAAPAAPVDLRVEAGDREARLAWQPPARLTDGGAVSGPLVYEILRAPSADAPLAPIARTLPDTTAATDRGLENDRTYYYAVRAIRQEGATPVEGDPDPASPSPSFGRHGSRRSEANASGSWDPTAPARPRSSVRSPGTCRP